MKTLKFKCTLLSDVILNRKSASEGSNNTLDFIPGNAFLGIVASHYQEFSKEEAWTIFHSGRVRFGDGHPVAAGNVRSLRVPASWFYPKMKSITDVCYIHHFYDRGKDNKENDGEPQQLKQCREGFYEFDSDVSKAAKVLVQKSFAIKSAYDRAKRRALDECMYGYESLDAGMQFLFKVEVDDDAWADKIKEKLEGRKHIGRSRTAQYGEVKIEECDFAEVPTCPDPIDLHDGHKYVTVYADSRLLFFDNFHEDKSPEFTLQPTGKDLGIKGGEIDWEKSQVRTFQYAPWNGKRQNWDADRMGIEKGSVFVVKLPEGPKPNLQSTCVGVYQNEGFGAVIYNPAFLRVREDTNGEARIQFKNAKSNAKDIEDKDHSDKPVPQLLNFLVRRKKHHEAQTYIYQMVNEFVEKNRDNFKGERFASQWGAIRSIAMQERTAEEIKNALFDDKSKDDKDKGYLMHGVAKDQWDKSGRRDKLQGFVDEVELESPKEEYGDILREALINLCSEMAKVCKKEGGEL